LAMVTKVPFALITGLGILIYFDVLASLIMPFQFMPYPKSYALALMAV